MRAFVAGVLLLAGASRLYGDCVQPRPEIRFAIDSDAREISPWRAVTATVSELHGRYTRRETAGAGSQRVRPDEFTVYQVDAILSHFEGDYQPIDPDAHYVLTLTTPDRQRAMQVEVPSPHCAGNSPLYDEILRVRNQFDLQFPVKPYERRSPDYDIPVRVTGVAFLETSNGWRTLRLAPLLNLEFNPADFNAKPAEPKPVTATAEAPQAEAEQGSAPETVPKRSGTSRGLAVLAIFGALAAVAVFLVRR